MSSARDSAGAAHPRRGEQGFTGACKSFCLSLTPAERALATKGQRETTRSCCPGTGAAPFHRPGPRSDSPRKRDEEVLGPGTGAGPVQREQRGANHEEADEDNEEKGTSTAAEEWPPTVVPRRPPGPSCEEAAGGSGGTPGVKTAEAAVLPPPQTEVWREDVIEVTQRPHRETFQISRRGRRHGARQLGRTSHLQLKSLKSLESVL